MLLSNESTLARKYRKMAGICHRRGMFFIPWSVEKALPIRRAELLPNTDIPFSPNLLPQEGSHEKYKGSSKNMWNFLVHMYVENFLQVFQIRRLFAGLLDLNYTLWAFLAERFSQVFNKNIYKTWNTSQKVFQAQETKSSELRILFICLSDRQHFQSSILYMKCI